MVHVPTINAARAAGRHAMFTATIEYVTSTRAIVALFDSTGAWAGASRVDITHGGRPELYEAGYARANQAATLKGGTLGRFSEEA